jgi:hypothetical protein
MPGIPIKSVSEKDKYITDQPSSNSRRVAWLKIAGLSITSAVSLLVKGTLNLVDAAFSDDKSISFKEAGRNFGAAVGLVLGATPLAMASAVIPRIGGYLVGKQIFTAPKYYQDYARRRIAFLQNNKNNSSAHEGAIVVTVFEEEGKPLEDVVLPPGSRAKSIQGLNHVIDVLDIRCSTATNDWRVYCCGQGSFSANWVKRIIKENETLGCNTRVYNNPGITRDEVVDSAAVLINACIEVTRNLWEDMGWSKEEAEKHLHICARSLGVGIALQADSYFLKQYAMSFMIWGDRSFDSLRSAMATRVTRMTGMPAILAQSFSTNLLHASGGWDFDSLKALSTLDPKIIYPFNLAIRSEQPGTLHERYSNFFGLRVKQNDADELISDESTLCYGVMKARISCGSTTQTLLREFKTDGRSLFPKKANGSDPYICNHDAPLTELSMCSPFDEKRTALDYYAGVFREFKQAKESKEALRINLSYH